MPQRAVQELQGVFSVMVVGADDTVEQRMVTPAERIGSLWVIASGLKAGERVVVDGLQKVRPGMKVSPKTVPIEERRQAKARRRRGADAPADAEPATRTSRSSAWRSSSSAARSSRSSSRS